jgi:hypothetical protein
MKLLYPCSLVTKRTKQWYIQNVCWRDNEVDTGSNITDRRYECGCVKNSQYKRCTGDNQAIKNKTLPKNKQ